MNVPGFPALHRVISPTCRQNKGDEQCAAEVRDDITETLLGVLSGWPVGSVRVHVAVTIERDAGAVGSPGG